MDKSLCLQHKRHIRFIDIMKIQKISLPALFNSGLCPGLLVLLKQWSIANNKDIDTILRHRHFGIRLIWFFGVGLIIFLGLTVGLPKAGDRMLAGFFAATFSIGEFFTLLEMWIISRPLRPAVDAANRVHEIALARGVQLFHLKSWKEIFLAIEKLLEEIAKDVLLAPRPDRNNQRNTDTLDAEFKTLYWNSRALSLALDKFDKFYEAAKKLIAAETKEQEAAECAQ